MRQAVFAILQEAVVPPLLPLHDQVLFVPQIVEALSLVGVPVLQVFATEPQVPITAGHAAFAILQEAVYPPLYPRHDQVCDHQQVPAL
jgi:hypothetical protein